MQFWPPVSAISLAIGPSRRGERAVDGDPGVGAAGEGDAVDARVARERGADRLAASGKEVQHVDRHARGVQMAHARAPQ